MQRKEWKVTDEHPELPDELEEHDEGDFRSDRRFVTGLARGLDVLSCFKSNSVFLSNSEIAKRTGLPKSTVSRLAFTLINLGYLEYSENQGKYHLGAAVLSLGDAFITKSNIRQVARPMMSELAEYSRATVALAVRDRLDMAYIELSRCTTTSFSVHVDVGSRVSLITTAIGNAYLCALEERQRERLLDQIMAENRGEWPKHKQFIEQSLKDYEERGFCISIGNWRKDINAVGVPYVSRDGSTIYAFNCAGPGFELRRHILEDDIGPRLVSLVRSLNVT